MAQREKSKENIAAIDIGSNAIRMIVASRDGNQLKVIKKFRFPIRLGADVFENGMISEKLLKEAAKTFESFKELSDEYRVHKIKAVGTSALREAKNQQQFLDLVKKRSDILVEVIDGVEEARLIHLAVRNEIELNHHRALLIDIGGGSVELTFSENALMTSTQSFPFGTVRTLDLMKKKKLGEAQLDLVIGDFVKPLGHFLSSQTAIQKLDFAIGTGGNLESLGKLKPFLLHKPTRSFLSLDELSQIIEILKKMSVKDRIERLKLRSDRADVIVPAALIVQTIMRQARLEKILIPYVGLKDGLLWALASK